MSFWHRFLWSLVLFLFLLSQSYGFTFTIVHDNDQHARYDPMQGSSGKCPKGDDEKGLCFGGFARVATAVAKARSEGPTLYLNAGDLFQGTSWYTVYKGDLAADLMNMLNPDAMSLGNHEFDDNIAGLMPFLNKAKFPIVSCNLDLSKVPEMQKVTNLMSSIIITKLEKPIGIIGYLTPETKNQVAGNAVDYYKEIPSINEEAKKLKKKGINIIIALGHSGYEMDQKIAWNCPDVDVVIGGHSHTFLFTGKPPSTDKPEGDYPTIITRRNGQQVPVLQAYAFTKYLGKIQLEFDDEGTLIKFSGSPMLLDSSVPHDSKMKSFLDSKRNKIDELDAQVVGITKVFLNGDRMVCRKKECNLGNLICDAIIYARVSEDIGGLYWTDAAIALLNGGGIRGSIERKSDGVITQNDILTALPFDSDLFITRIRGQAIWNALEHSASVIFKWTDGAFLQVSGIRVVIDTSMPEGRRVISVRVRCASCKVPSYSPLKDNKFYNVIVTKFLYDGGDGHKLVDEDHPTRIRLQKTVIESVNQYLQQNAFVYTNLEDRIKYKAIKENKISGSSTNEMSSLLILLISAVSSIPHT